MSKSHDQAVVFTPSHRLEDLRKRCFAHHQGMVSRCLKGIREANKEPISRVTNL